MIESPPEAVDALSFPIYGAYEHIRSLLRPGATVLDIGCGNGKVAAYLARAGAIVDGIEPSRDRAQVARGRMRYVSPEPAAGITTDTSLAQEYDLVMLLDVVEHVADPDPLLAWAASRVAPNGTLVALIPNSAHWSFRTQMLRGSWRYHDWGLFDRTHLRFYDPDTARALRPRGMKESAVHYFTPGSGLSSAAVRCRPRLFALHLLIEWTRST